MPGTPPFSGISLVTDPPSASALPIPLMDTEPIPGTCPSFGLGALTPSCPSLHLLPCDPLWPLGGCHPLPLSPWDNPTPAGRLHRGTPQRGWPGAGLYPQRGGWEQGYIPKGAGSRVISQRGWSGPGLYPQRGWPGPGLHQISALPFRALPHDTHIICV